MFTSDGLAGQVRTSVDAEGDYIALGNIGTDIDLVATNFDILRTDTNTVFTDAINTTTPPTIEDVQTELDKLEDANYTAYKALNGTQKLAAVQEFISAFPTNKDGDYTGYTTVSAYFAAVDAAIAK